MPWPQVGFETDGKRSLLNTFVKLEQVRVTGAESDPQNRWWTLRWKPADAGRRKEKCSEADLREPVPESDNDILGDVGEETEGEMHLFRVDRTHAANLRYEILDSCGKGRREVDRNEQTFAGHERICRGGLARGNWKQVVESKTCGRHGRRYNLRAVARQLVIPL